MVEAGVGDHLGCPTGRGRDLGGAGHMEGRGIGGESWGELQVRKLTLPRVLTTAVSSESGLG